MQEPSRQQHTRFFLLRLSGSILLAAGLIGASIIIAEGFVRSRQTDRYVTVKGLSEMEVKADLAVWNIMFSATGGDLPAVQRKIDEDSLDIVRFLTEQGFEGEEISPGRLRVQDRMSYSSYGEMPLDENRYTITSGLIVRSEKVDLVDRVSRMTGELVKVGVVMVDDYHGPSFLFTRLNDIKLGMLEEATGNARKAAKQFAADSGARLGGIRTANQGVFSILPRDRTFNASEESQIFKTVRVVSTVEYFLD